MFARGVIYNRQRDIHGIYGGQMRGGISTPAKHPLIFIFTGDSGTAFGYQDGWTDKGLFAYTGEGQRGDMSFKSGNKAIRDHVQDNKEILLFKILNRRRGVRFEGNFFCSYYETFRSLDVDAQERQAIRFLLEPLGREVTDVFDGTGIDDRSPSQTVDLETLRERAYSALNPRKLATQQILKRNYNERSKAVRDYVLARANGVCELTGQAAPFVTTAGDHYLEVHHTRRIADGGPDHPRWVAAITPSAHREIHFGRNGHRLNDILKEKLRRIEPPEE